MRLLVQAGASRVSKVERTSHREASQLPLLPQPGGAASGFKGAGPPVDRVNPSN
jgi:hypothetical protein